MPKSKLADAISNTRVEYPPIDWVSALLLERMKSLGYSFKSLAAKTHINYDVLRHEYMKPIHEWREDVRLEVCGLLGLELDIVTRTYPCKDVEIKIRPKGSDYWFEVHP